MPSNMFYPIFKNMMMNQFLYISTACLLSFGITFQSALLAEESWSKDLAFYRSQVFEADKSYSGDERKEAEELLLILESTHQDLSDPQIELALARISAVTNNGHSFLMPGGWTHRYARLPINFRVFSDGTFIISATGEFQHLVGLRLVSLNNHSAENLAAAWAIYQGGKNGWRNLYLPYFLETPAMLVAAGLISQANGIRVVLEDDDGEIIETEIPALSDLPPLEGMDQYIAPSRLLVSANQAPKQHLPLYLQSPGQTFRFETLENPTTAYIQFRANTDFTGTQNINAFIDAVLGQLRDLKPRFIVLDQRFNFGGDLNVTRELMQKLPDFLAADGKLFAITSGKTFSAGISSLGYVKQAAPERVTIVGEPVGDELEFWAEGDIRVLPDSGVTFLIATERHNYQTGCPEVDCHGAIKRHPIEVDSLQPDIPTPLSYRQFQQGIDPAMIAIQEEIQKIQ